MYQEVRNEIISKMCMSVSAYVFQGQRGIRMCVDAKSSCLSDDEADHNSLLSVRYISTYMLFHIS